VPDVTNIQSAVLPELNGALRLGASRLPSVSCLGISVPAAGPFGVVAAALPRVRDKAAVMVAPAPQHAVTALVDQANIHNYMTGVSATGEGASGPPRDREPA
jgi:hypothetical protein